MWDLQMDVQSCNWGMKMWEMLHFAVWYIYNHFGDVTLGSEMPRHLISDVHGWVIDDPKSMIPLLA